MFPRFLRLCALRLTGLTLTSAGVGYRSRCLCGVFCPLLSPTGRPPCKPHLLKGSYKPGKHTAPFSPPSARPIMSEQRAEKRAKTGSVPSLRSMLECAVPLPGFAVFPSTCMCSPGVNWAAVLFYIQCYGKDRLARPFFSGTLDEFVIRARHALAAGSRFPLLDTFFPDGIWVCSENNPEKRHGVCYPDHAWFLSEWVYRFWTGAIGCRHELPYGSCVGSCRIDWTRDASVYVEVTFKKLSECPVTIITGSPHSTFPVRYKMLLGYEPCVFSAPAHPLLQL